MGPANTDTNIFCQTIFLPIPIYLHQHIGHQYWHRYSHFTDIGLISGIWPIFWPNGSLRKHIIANHECANKLFIKQKQTSQKGWSTLSFHTLIIEAYLPLKCRHCWDEILEQHKGKSPYLTHAMLRPEDIGWGQANQHMATCLNIHSINTPVFHQICKNLICFPTCSHTKKTTSTTVTN